MDNLPIFIKFPMQDKRVGAVRTDAILWIRDLTAEEGSGARIWISDSSWVDTSLTADAFIAALAALTGVPQ